MKLVVSLGMVAALASVAYAEEKTGIGADLENTSTKIVEVYATRGAIEAGLKVGDVITHVNDVPVKTRAEVGKHTIGPSCTAVKVTVDRAGKSLTKWVIRKPQEGVCGPLCGSRPDPDRKRVSRAEARRQSEANIAMMKADRFGKQMLAAYKREYDLVDASTGGFPEYNPEDLHPTFPNDINLGSLCGSRRDDEEAANAMAGLRCTPDDYTWHHHQDFARMMLVKRKAHQAEHHNGGVSIWKRAFCTKGVRESHCRYDQSGGSRPRCPNP